MVRRARGQVPSWVQGKRELERRIGSRFFVGLEPPVSGDLDPDYFVWRDGELLTDAPEEACPSTWTNTVTAIEAFAPTNDPFQVDVWANDAISAPELICSWAWDPLGTGEAGPIPAAWLAAGGWSGTFSGCSAEFEFVLVE